MSFVTSLLDHVSVESLIKCLPSVLATVGATLFGWILAGWRWRRRLRQVRDGDGMDVLSVEQVLLTREKGGRRVLRLRACGAVPLAQALPNPVANSHLLKVAESATDKDPILGLRGPEGFYLRNEMKKIVSNFVSNRPFRHDQWVMTLVREVKKLRGHQSITILLVRVRDLEEVFLRWSKSRAIEVEEESDAGRLLTLHLLAVARDKELKEQRPIEARSMCVLDLPLDTRYARMPSHAVNWKGPLHETLLRLGLPVNE
jgi:hypothetical protein